MYENINFIVSIMGGGGSSASIVYEIGDEGPGGGIIFYVDAAGFTMTGIGTCHYLEAAPVDEVSYWSETERLISGMGTALGTGKHNTDLILAEHPDDPADKNAAKTCKEYSNNGKSDWFLPSKDELNLLYENNVFDISSGEYWSSSQHLDGEGYLAQQYAWYQNFYSGGVQGYYGKMNPKVVRAIRAF